MTAETAASTIANTAQQEYWNTVAGPRWVGLGGFVERRVRAINDLLLARSALAPGERVVGIGCGTVGATRAEQALADPLRGRPAASGAAGAKARAGTGAAGIQRARLRARLSRSGRLGRHRDPPRDARHHRFDPGGRGRARLHHGTLG